MLCAAEKLLLLCPSLKKLLIRLLIDRFGLVRAKFKGVSSVRQQLVRQDGILPAATRWETV